MKVGSMFKGVSGLAVAFAMPALAEESVKNKNSIDVSLAEEHDLDSDENLDDAAEDESPAMLRGLGGAGSAFCEAKCSSHRPWCRRDKQRCSRKSSIAACLHDHRCEST